MLLQSVKSLMNWCAAGAMLILVLSLSCTPKKGEYGLDLKETLRININTEPPSLDWNKSSDTTSSQIQDNIMEGLVQYDLKDPDLKLKPALATQWEPNADASVWTFTLREGVKWTDGVEFTAQHVVDGWERLLNPNTASPYAYFLYDIKNAQDYSSGKLDDFSKVGISVNEKGQLVVTLNGPKSYFPSLLTHSSTFPIRKDVIAKNPDTWTEPENIVTLGAYILKVWDHDKAIVMTRNKDYYGTPAVTKNILAYMINDMSTALNLFDTDKLDAQTNLPSTELKILRQRPEYQEKGILSIYYYGFNVKKAPFDNPKVRKAISHSIDRKQITDMLGGGQIPLTSWIPTGMFGYEPDKGINFDPEKAKQLLAEAGYADPSKLPKIEIGFNTNEDHQRIAENVQAQLKKNLGIRVELKNEEWKVYLNSLRNDPPHIYRIGWLADFPDPDNFMTLMTSYSDNNYTGWENKEYDKIVEQAARSQKREERRELYSKAQSFLTEMDVPVVPIYSSVSRILVNERVSNFPHNAMDKYIYKEVALK